ncbi:MAG: HAD family hydrolase [Acidimicrobiales bacterium]|jgi:HAD superfamily hydrolase (TIGR01549 family)
MREIDTVVFDVGETLICEDRSWSEWAQWLGVSTAVLFACLGATITAREDHRRTFDLIVPGFDFEHEQQAKEAAGYRWRVVAEDFYPDAIASITELRALNFKIGIAGNQPASIEEMLTGLGLPVDFVITSGSLGVEKPSSAFFEQIARTAEREPERIAYVGDRLDNDVVPAARAGMMAIFIRRGPWGYLHANWPEIEFAHARIDGLDEVARVVAQPGQVERRSD